MKLGDVAYDMKIVLYDFRHQETQYTLVIWNHPLLNLAWMTNGTTII